jgi:FKBP-type peptidyl-prolyl cis-trans isomerase FklB
VRSFRSRRKSIKTLCWSWLALSLVFCGCKGGDFSKPENKISYVIGQSLAADFNNQGFIVNADALKNGVRDALKGESKLSKEDMQKTLMEFQQAQMAKMQSKQMELSQANTQTGEAFLAANKQKPDVVTLPSGLQYKVLKKGAGRSPKASDTVEVHYVGTLISGQKFDSSYKRNQAARFPVTGVIPGWTEALQLMKAGDKWQLFIPSNLAYGDQGAGGIIGPGQTLLFEVELLKII